MRHRWVWRAEGKGKCSKCKTSTKVVSRWSKREPKRRVEARVFKHQGDPTFHEKDHGCGTPSSGFYNLGGTA